MIYIYIFHHLHIVERWNSVRKKFFFPSPRVNITRILCTWRWMTRKKSTMKGYTRVEVQRNLVSLLKGSSGVYQESISQSVFECRRKTARQRRASPFLSPPANVVLRFCFFLLRRRSEYTITWKCLASRIMAAYTYTLYIYIYIFLTLDNFISFNIAIIE